MRNDCCWVQNPKEPLQHASHSHNPRKYYINGYSYSPSVRFFQSTGGGKVLPSHFPLGRLDNHASTSNVKETSLVNKCRGNNLVGWNNKIQVLSFTETSQGKLRTRCYTQVKPIKVSIIIVSDIYYNKKII